MTKNCPRCGETNDEDAKFCDNCGTSIETIELEINETFIEKNKIPLIIIGTTALLVGLFLIISPSEIPNSTVFNLEGEPTKRVDVDGIFIKIPEEFTFDPKSLDLDYKNYVMSSSKGWSHETEHIGSGVMRIFALNANPNEAIGANGGVQKNMYGYNGYYIEHEDGYSFTFTKDNKICIIMVSSPYLFDKISIE